jgi:hypothetical protein
MWGGKSAPWYFLVRLTCNQNFGDGGVGDRILAMWQGAGFYHFATMTIAQNAAYPDDIEGLWTYVYYSHSVALSRSVGFIKFSTADPKRVQNDVVHPAITYLKFILAGKQFNYPGFNGIFTRVVYKIGAGAFIDTLDQATAFIATQGPVPSGLLRNVTTL